MNSGLLIAVRSSVNLDDDEKIHGREPDTAMKIYKDRTQHGSCIWMVKAQPGEAASIAFSSNSMHILSGEGIQKHSAGCICTP